MRRAWLLLAAIALVCLPRPVMAAASGQQKQAEQKLAAVRARIDTLTRQQHAATARRDRLNQALIEQARALDQAAADLRETDQALDVLDQRLRDLQDQQQQVQARLDAQHEALAELLRATYKLGHGSDLRMLLGHVTRCPPAADGADSGDCSPGEQALARVQRALAYSRYFQADRTRRIRELLEQLAQRRQLAEQIDARKLELQQQRETRRARRDALDQARQAQQQLLARAEAEIQTRHARLQTLQQNRKALEKLLRDLRDVFADIPAEMPDETPFDKQRGKLPWPLAGSAQTQKDGIVIAAKAGTRVHAVAHGRVAYADWLRGYGMLLIIDHGQGWMSLYGGNESLLRSVGDWVNAGDAVATSGQGEGNVAGLYFGLRHDGKPVNPRPWLGKP